MKRFFIAGSILMFALMVSAQNQNQGGQRFRMSEEERMKRYEDMKKEVKMNTAQLDSIKKFDAEFAPKQRELREKYRDDREKMREESQKLRNQLETKVKKVLNEDQFKKYQEFISQRRQRGNGNGGGGNRNR